MKIDIFEKAILEYNEFCEKYNYFAPLSGSHFSGTCVVFFKGKEEDCEKVKNFIKYEMDKY